MDFFSLLYARAHFAVFVRSGPLVSVVVDCVLVYAFCCVLGPDVWPLLAEIAEVSGHQFQVVARKSGKAVGDGVNLNQDMFQSIH